MNGSETARARDKVSGFTLALNWLPFLYIVTGVLIALGAGVRGGSLAAFSLAWIYLVPPLVCRTTLAIAGYPEGRGLDQQASAYKLWWFLSQWQVVLNRVPLLDELLRLVPGLYPLWLGLWGSRVSLFAYWAPGALVVDRYLLRVERGAVIGTGVLLSGHLGVQGEDGSFRVDVAPVEIAAGAIIGAGAKLGPGCRVAGDELVPAGRLLKPFSIWQRGRKQARTAQQAERIQ